MKITLKVLVFLFLATNLASCTPEAIYDQTDTTQSTVLGEDEDDPEDEDDMDNGL